MTNPSRSLSKGQDAGSGASLWVDSARQGPADVPTRHHAQPDQIHIWRARVRPRLMGGDECGFLAVIEPRSLDAVPTSAGSFPPDVRDTDG
ncbi:hypothetical protein ADK54_31080 [Streptomyces sp. WM6378]|nr:hypothetical protein ADK54_31080 [Streptomyces sp. WM6378]